MIDVRQLVELYRHALAHPEQPGDVMSNDETYVPEPTAVEVAESAPAGSWTAGRDDTDLAAEIRDLVDANSWIRWSH